MRRCLLAALLVLGTSASAGAQIYAWQDGSGAWVLSDRKLDADARTFAVPEARTFRTTRAAAPRVARQRYEPLIQAHAARAGLPPELVRAVIQVESGFNPRARSPKGAMGLMQLMPATAAWLGVNRPFDPDQNIAGGTTYLRTLLERFDGNLELALAAYNAGPGAVERFGLRVPPFAETTRYVDRVGAIASPDAVPSVRPGRPSPAPRRPKPGTTPPAAARPAPQGAPIYRVVDIVDGRPVARYTTERPASSAYDIVSPGAPAPRKP